MLFFIISVFISCISAAMPPLVMSLNSMLSICTCLYVVSSLLMEYTFCHVCILYELVFSALKLEINPNSSCFIASFYLEYPSAFSSGKASRCLLSDGELCVSRMDCLFWNQVNGLLIYLYIKIHQDFSFSYCK